MQKNEATVKTILLLAYYFYPYPAVGANTWNHLSVALCRLGYTVHVITVNWPKNANSTHPDPHGLYRDKLFIHRIPSRYPLIFHYGNSGFTGFIAKFWNRLIKPIFYWDDIAQLWKKALLRKAKEIISTHNIKIVFATGYPFRVNYYAALLKTSLPDLTLIQHFRDEWIHESNKLSPRRKSKQLELQRFSIEHADRCYTVSEGLAFLISENKQYYKWGVLPSGCNPNSINWEEIKTTEKKHQTDIPIIFTYIGNVACGRFELIELFIHCIRQMQNKLCLVYIGNHANKIKKQFAKEIQDGIVEVYPAMSQKEALLRVVQGDWCLQLNSHLYSYGISTKIYEYGMVKKPTLSINYGGEIEHLIEKHKLGLSVNLNKQDLLNQLWKIVNREINLDFTYNIAPFTFDSIARNLDKVCTQIIENHHKPNDIRPVSHV